MKKLKWKTLVLALLLAALGTVSAGTLAYFTAEETAHNVITSGGVDIELIERIDEDTLWPKDGVTGIMPGEDVAKIVTVKNTGASAAWIRVKVDVGITKADGTAGDPALIEIVDYNTRDWTQKDGWWYYNKSAAPGAETEVLFTKVRFNTAMDNPYQNCKVSVDVSAQAVQTANNGASAPEAAGWPEE